MATVATLTIDLIGQSGKLRSELARANKSTKSWATSTRSQVNAVGKAFAASTALSAGALTAVYASAASQADKLAKTSDKLGILPERLSGIQFAGEQTGVAIETTNKALQKMSDVVSDATRGVGEGAAALETLNINAAELAKLSPDKQFSVIAEAMKGVTNQNEKLNIAIDLFGQRGAGLVNTLALGSDGLNAMQVEADALGITLNRIELAKIEGANDAFNRAKVSTSAFGKVLAAEVSPFVAALSDEFVTAAKEAGGFGRVATNGVTSMAEGAAFAADIVRGLGIAWLGVRQAVAETTNAYVQFVTVGARGADFLAKLMGVDKTSIGRAAANVVEFADSFSATTDILAEELNKKALAPMPSETVRKWVEDVQAKATAAAAEVAANASGTVAAGVVVDTSVVTGGTDTSAEYEKLLEGLRTEEEAIRVSYEKKRELIIANTAETGEARATLLADINEREFNDVNTHLSRMGSLEASWKLKQAKFDKATFAGKAKLLTGGLAAMSEASAQHSKKMFKINKIAAIAEATVSVAQGVAAGVKLGWPAGIPAVAWALATGLPQIAAIKSTSFQGGGTGTTPSAAASSPVINDIPVTSSATPLTATNNGVERGTVIQIHGDIHSNDAERLLADLKSLISDGDHVLIESTSRNGQELSSVA